MVATKPKTDTFIGNDYPPACSEFKPGNFKVVDGSLGSVSKNAMTPEFLKQAAVGAGSDPSDLGIQAEDKMSLEGKNRINAPFRGG